MRPVLVTAAALSLFACTVCASHDHGWYSQPAPQNARFFADRRHKQVLCGYYDRAPGSFYDMDWLAKTKDVPGILGVMYTPWSTGYDNIEAWAQAVWGGRPR